MSFRRYHKSQAIYLESKDNTKISCVISSVGTSEVCVRVPALICVRVTAAALPSNDFL